MGGNAFSFAGKVSKDEVLPTVKHVIDMMRIKDREYCIIGSTGKKAFSGDIDIAINISKEELMLKLEKLFSRDQIRSYGNVRSICVPIQDFNKALLGPSGEERSGFAQIDFIIGDIEWLSLYYHWDETSSLKGTHRNIALSTLASYTKRKVYTDELDTRGRPVNYSRHKWSPVQGLVYVNLTTPVDKHGHYRSTQIETVISSGLYKKAEIANILFAGKLDDKYMDSAESIIEAITLIFDEAQQQEVLLELFHRFETNHNVGSYYDQYPVVLQQLKDIYESSR